MKETTSTDLAPASNIRSKPLRSSGMRTFLTVLGVLAGLGAVTVASAAWWYEHNFHASLRPVRLSADESKIVEQKVQTLQGKAEPAADPSKTLVLSEREINGFLEKQGVGDQFKVTIHSGSLGATALVPVDKDAPILGGKTIRLHVVFNTSLDAQHHLNFSLADVTVGGLSVPSDWLGGLKGLNLLADLQDDEFFKSLSAGIKDFQARDGEVRLVLND